ncbi:RNA polymerase sigma factor rpoD [Candidatus Hodgkinia cicadicola]|uniref:RNA polymerase sigma factor rpoD n=1 Tax=Candidatus Hodgkinia cicadicola TaxID=573658 RepID=A0ABX4MFN6_9HYPH|nr:RNA polymerase sigma factor rpoD [Candidatus Hodgkinia cicadicola]
MLNDSEINYSKRVEDKLFDMARKLQLTLYINVFKSPIIIKLLFQILEELYSSSLDIHELFDINLDYNRSKWHDHCVSQINNYSLEYSYIRYFKGDTMKDNSWFKSCKCRICVLLRLLYNAVMSKDTSRNHWCIANILIKLEFDVKVMQLSWILMLFLKHNLRIIRLICLNQRRVLRHLISVLKIDSNLRRIKRQMVKACLWIPSNISAAYYSYGVPRSVLISAGITGLMIAINRFNFLGNQSFSTYAKWWVNQKIIQTIINNNEGLGSIRRGNKLNNKTIRLKKLSLDYCLDDSNLHETVADNDIDIDEDGEKDDDDEGNINEIMEIPNVYDHNATARLVLMSPFEERSVRMKKINHGKISLSNIGLNLGLSKERIRQLLLSANTKFIEMNSINIDEELRTKPIDLPCMDLNKRWR